MPTTSPSELHSQLYDQALAFLLRQAFSDSQSMLARCVEHLQAQSDSLSFTSAERIAAQAMGEIECRHQHGVVDLDATTSHAVFLRDRSTGKTYVFSAASLVALVSLCLADAPPEELDLPTAWVRIRPAERAGPH